MPTDYKNKNSFRTDDLRRRREEHQGKIRRQNREENIAKRRNLAVSNDGSAAVRGSNLPIYNPVLLLCGPAIPTPLPHHPCLASRFARGTCLPRLTCSLSQPNPELIQAVFLDDSARQLEATTKLRELLSNAHNPSRDHIIACGVVPRFLEFLTGPHAALQVG